MRKGLPPCAFPPLGQHIEPCLPRPADRPPAGRDWLHEIKHDGFRSWHGAMLPVCGSSRETATFRGTLPRAAAAVATPPARSCLIDGEAIVADQSGLAVFDLIRLAHSAARALFQAPRLAVAPWAGPIAG